MSWTEQEQQTRRPLVVTAEKAELLDRVKRESHPIITHEAALGDKGVAAIEFQPVKSPGIFEAEFAKKGDDVIFHFWPWGLHAAERSGKPRPPFQKDFYDALIMSVAFVYERNVEVSEDRDMGAWFVKASGAGQKQFWRDLAIKMVSDLHRRLGGE